jgi:uncharacterized protein
MSSPFLKLFGKSPFKGLLTHIDVVCQCAYLLDDFFQAVVKNDWAEAERVQLQIATLENEADEHKQRLRRNLPKDLFLPVARGDILAMLSHQDHMANHTKDIAGLVLGRRMVIPEVLQADFLPFVRRSLDAVRQAYKSVRELSDLHEAGFGGRETHTLCDMVDELHHIEHDTDNMQIALRRQLFEIENDLPAVHVMFLYQILESIGALADDAETTGDRLLICIAR